MPKPTPKPTPDARPQKKRIGGRGCPNCGSHDTEGVKGAGVQWCLTCRHRWNPCSPGCRGYTVDLKGANGPTILGCERCGVPDLIARHWPEAWRALAARLDGKKLEAVEAE